MSALSEEQAMLGDSVRRLLTSEYGFDRRQAIAASVEGFSVAFWRRLAELGLLALPIPEESGGFGGSLIDLVTIAEPFGAHLLVEPFLSSIVLSGSALAVPGGHATAFAWLSRIMAQDALAAFAHEEGINSAGCVTLATRADGLVVSGRKTTVLGGDEAQVLVVSAVMEGRDEPSLFLVDPTAAGVTKTPFTMIDGRRAAHITLNRVATVRTDLLVENAGPVIERIVAHGIVYMAAESVGAMQALLDVTAEFAGTRRQFDAPLASFQVIAHRMADMKIAVTKARALLLHTTMRMDASHDTQQLIPVLKAQIGRLGRFVAEAAIQIHGGVGMTDELPIGHFFKRLIVNDTLFGQGDDHFVLAGRGR